MRDLFDRADLARYAGQFVWLDVNYDVAANSAFFAKYPVSVTPTFLIINPASDRILELQAGAMSLREVTEFLEQGAARLRGTGQTPADVALSRGDSLRARSAQEAIAAYETSLRVAPADWPKRALAETSLVSALQSNRQYQSCADRAAAAASGMARDSMFARLVMTGLWCTVSGQNEAWVPGAFEKLEPLGKEALTLPATVRDHRDEIYRTFMIVAVNLKDTGAAARWGDRWLEELDAITPATDDERSALDIARVENVGVYGDPARILGALRASEQAMPGNYNASLRLAQVEELAGQHDEALAAIERGLTRTPGALGRSWLFQLKADVLKQQGKPADAERALEAALLAAGEIPTPDQRRNNVNRVKTALRELQGKKRSPGESVEQDRAAIERLDSLDMKATLITPEQVTQLEEERAAADGRDLTEILLQGFKILPIPPAVRHLSVQVRSHLIGECPVI